MTEGSKFTDYYAMLGISPTTEMAAIRRAFIEKAKRHHPDAGGSTDYMQQLNAAYKTLMTPTAKAAYDMLHNFHTGKTAGADYKYQGGKHVDSYTDMSDDAVDMFLDNLFQEYRNGVPKPKLTVKDRLKKILDI